MYSIAFGLKYELIPLINHKGKSVNLKFVYRVAQFTRWLQSLSPKRPIGISTLSKKFAKFLPDYQGVIQLKDGLYFDVDTQYPPEQSIFFVGDRHRVVTTLMMERVKSGAFCLDIGANIGFYTLKLAQLAGKEGRVAAFEANPNLLSRIKHNIDLNHLQNVEIIPKAVSQSSGIVEFYIAPNSELSSLDYIENAQEKIRVEALRIDDFIKDANWQRLDFIKVDIEGHDCQALLGAKQSLERFLPDIVLEYQYNMDKNVADELFSYLESLGYRFNGLILKTSQHIPFDKQKAPNEKTFHINVFCESPKQS